MKRKSVIIILVIVAVLIVGIGAIYAFSLGENNQPSAGTSNDANEVSQEAQNNNVSAISIGDALSTIGAVGSEGPVNGNTYIFNDVEYKFEQPTSWDTSLSQRKQACDMGYINTSYQVVTDGSTWFATTNNNSDYAVLMNALKDVGVKAEIASYC